MKSSLVLGFRLELRELRRKHPILTNVLTSIAAGKILEWLDKREADIFFPPARQSEDAAVQPSARASIPPGASAPIPPRENPASMRFDWPFQGRPEWIQFTNFEGWMGIVCCVPFPFTAVRAAGDGLVTAVRHQDREYPDAPSSFSMVIDHQFNFQTVYTGLGRPEIHQQQTVKIGQRIGTSQTLKVKGQDVTELFFYIVHNNVCVDPRLYLPLIGVRSLVDEIGPPRTELAHDIAMFSFETLKGSRLKSFGSSMPHR